MNNNIKETTSLVFVKGKNLFDKNKIVAGYILAQDGSIAPPNNSEASSDYIAIESSNPYTFSVSNYTVQTGGSMWLAISLFDSNKNIIARYADYNISSITVTASQTVNAKYIRVSYRYNDSNIKCQLEYCSTATAYEPYVEKQIHIKNKNGVFEKFFGESELNQENYSLNEIKIGTWINGKPLYRKIYQFNLPECATSGTPAIESHTINSASFAFIEFGYIYSEFINAPMPYFTRQNPSQNIGYDLTSPNTLRIWNSFKDWNSAKILVSVLYTKTID